MVSDNSEQLKKISNEVENLKLRTSVNTEIPGYESFLTKFEFPLSTKEQFIDFNEFLKNDNDFKASVSEFLIYLKLLMADIKQSARMMINYT